MQFSRILLKLITLTLSATFVLVACTLAPPDEGVRTDIITVVVFYTATPNPETSPEVTIITATPDRTQVSQTQAVASANAVTFVTQGAVRTTIPGTNNTVVAVPQSILPAGCILHIVDEGDTIFGLADEYGVNPFVMLEANGFTEETAFLNIGDELIVPVEGCPLDQLNTTGNSAPETTSSQQNTEATEEATEELETATPEFTPTPLASPTVTLAPTAVNSEIEIVEVLRAGDVTVEGVRIRNNGRLVDLTDWTITDSEDNIFTFSELLLFSNSEHTVYTRSGENSSIASYWGLEVAAWEPGDVVTLSDTGGTAQAVFRIEDDDSP